MAPFCKVHHDSHNHSTCTPFVHRLNKEILPAPSSSPLSQWPQGNLSYSDRLTILPSRVMVRLFPSTEAQSYSITFSLMVHSVLAMTQVEESMPIDLGLWRLFEHASTWLSNLFLLPDVPRVTTCAPPNYPNPCS
jgi:hypothetical protein